MSVPAPPEELLAHVFSYLETDVDFDLTNPSDEGLRRDTLVNVCLASKTFYQIARPIRYQTIDLTSAGERHPVGSIGITEMLLNNTRTAASVSRLRIPRHFLQQTGASGFVQLENADAKTLDGLSNLVRNAEVFDFYGLPLSQLVRMLRTDAWHTALIFLCTNLELFHLECLDFENNTPSMLLRYGDGKDPRDADPPSQSLRELVVRSKVDDDCIRVYQTLQILCFPRLRVFRGGGVIIDVDTYDSLYKSGIERLELYESGVSLQGLSVLLQTCTKLQHVTIEYEGNGSTLFEELGHLGNALRQSGPSLQSLTLRTDKIKDFWIASQGSVGSLRSLDVLVSLSLPWLTLAGQPPQVEVPLSQILPLLIQELHFLGLRNRNLALAAGCILQLISDEQYRDLRAIDLEVHGHLLRRRPCWSTMWHLLGGRRVGFGTHLRACGGSNCASSIDWPSLEWTLVIDIPSAERCLRPISSEADTCQRTTAGLAIAMPQVRGSQQRTYENVASSSWR